MRFFALALAFLAAAAFSQEIPAFPGAEGFGAMTPGGRGGQVLLVTSLDDSGPGSLRAAVETPGPRMIVFRVGGIIDLQKRLVVREPFVTIAGQTAPGDGVCLRGNNFAINTHDVIVRFLRARLGDVQQAEVDTISIEGASRNVILDHCSASWSVDETLSPSDEISDVTVGWCLISESLWRSVHSKGPHGYGSLVRAMGGVSLHHNLWANHDGRNPRLGDDYGAAPFPTYDVRNNVIYNYGSYCSGMTDGNIQVNYVSNYIKPGPNSTRRPPIVMIPPVAAETRFYLAGNVVENHPEWTGDNTRMFDQSGVTVAPGPFEVPPVTTQSASDAYREVLDHVGATVPVRDAVDERVILQVKNNTGRLIDSQKDVGGWPEYRTGTPDLDSDEDGIPDWWEIEHRLNPNEPSDGAAARTSGYTNLEVYLNELADPRLAPRGVRGIKRP